MQPEALTQQNEYTRLLRRLRDLLQEEGLYTACKRLVDKVSVYLQYPWRKRQLKDKRITIMGREIPYFIHHYNATWRNERSLEIALAKKLIEEWGDVRVLELGNVMSYYMQHSFCVVDKYEKSPGVISQDFLTFQSPRPWDAFLALSTFEHIGWDEADKSKEKLKQCLDKISSQVNNKDRVLVTCPLLYNPFLDELVRDGTLPFAKVEYFVRSKKNPDWQCVDQQTALDNQYRYNKDFQGAQSLMVGLGVH